MAISCGLTVQRLAELIFPYLTTVEGLKLAALWATSKSLEPGTADPWSCADPQSFDR
jgi:hypothetical protein